MNSTVSWLNQTIDPGSSWTYSITDNYLGVEVLNDTDAISVVNFRTAEGGLVYRITIGKHEKTEWVAPDGDLPQSLTIDATSQIHVRPYYRGAEAGGPFPGDDE